MNAIQEFDGDRFFLGKLCKYLHEWNNTGQSLRHKNTGRVCKQCRQNTHQKYHKNHYQPRSERPDAEVTYLGEPCKYGHLADGKYSLRYTVGKQCVQCLSDRVTTPEHRQRRRDYYHQNAEKYRELSKQSKQRRREKIIEEGKIYYQKNRERILVKVNEYRQNNLEVIRVKHRNYYQQYRELYALKGRLYRQKPEVRERSREAGRRHRLKHRDEINAKIRLKRNSDEYRQQQREYRKRYTATERGKLVVLLGSHRHHARKASNHSSAYTPEQLTAHLQPFNNSCAYCGACDRKITLDHFIPVSKGGADVLSNIVACCQSCNSSKGNRDAKEWYTGQLFYTNPRWKKILQVLNKTEATLNQLPLF